MASISDPLKNVGAEGIPYYTPAQNPPAGTALDPQPDGKPLPKLFQPLRIRGAVFQNRLWLSPMCQYSAKDGVPTPWHFAHLGGILKRGPGLTMTEATAVLPEGRISPEDTGIWNDAQAAEWAKITTFAHSQGQKVGVQLAHAGRKASMVAPWLSLGAAAGPAQDGWPDAIFGPSAIAHGPGYYTPQELTKEGIARVRDAFVDAAKRAVAAGFDVVEIHTAHGYLLHEFMSPIANKRTDEYGGSFENRIRLHVEIIDAIRAVIPEDMPLFLRLSGSDHLEHALPNEASWRVEDSARLAAVAAAHGVDLIDVSSGGVHPQQEIRLANMDNRHPAYQAHLADHIRKATGGKVLVAAVGGIRTAKVAEEVLQNGWADVCFAGRAFLKNPGAVWAFAEELGVVINQALQIEWGFIGRGGLGRKAGSQL
ncbi:FMN-linked oxidoreductase [Phanerochaete sordida]|uniref:FMN-linked oxidoreductase n=1 Tax=Phanerochaete sordida TaxID=48140 RepID=A0A9P3GGF1_9APHY|nr:FMN-linked oxidoreductase [Phanerochaete sordida]